MGASSATAQRTDARALTAFEQYVRGSRTIVEGAVIFLESGTHLDDVLRLAVPGDIVIAPAGPAPRGSIQLIGYDGDFRAPGDDMILDGRHPFELQDHLTVDGLTLVGPTVVRHGTADGVSAFLRDADTARESGIFPRHLLSTEVLLDSRSSFLHAELACDPLVRIHVSADGEYRDGPDGLLLGHVGDERADVEAMAAQGAGRARALARIIDRRVLGADLDDRPWFERYLAALDLLREWAGPPPTISGFGGHLVTALDTPDTSSAVLPADAPFLVTEDGEGFVFVDRASGLRLRLGVDSARVVESLLATGDEAAAAELLATETGGRVGTAASLVGEVRAEFHAVGVELTAYRQDAA